MSPDKHLDPLHEQAIEAACDLDRAYFDGHPDQDGYYRQAVDHETCAAFTGCVDHSQVVIEVTSFGPGLRARRPIPAGVRA